MTDADTQVGTATPIVTLIAEAGLVPEPGVVDADGLATVTGPLLVTELVDGEGQRVGLVAVVDAPGAEAAAQSKYLSRSSSAPVLSAEADLEAFRKEIEPILGRSCVECHGPDQQKAKFRVDTLDPDLVHGEDADWWLEDDSHRAAGQ